MIPKTSRIVGTHTTRKFMRAKRHTMIPRWRIHEKSRFGNKIKVTAFLACTKTISGKFQICENFPAYEQQLPENEWEAQWELRLPIRKGELRESWRRQHCCSCTLVIAPVQSNLNWKVCTGIVYIKKTSSEKSWNFHNRIDFYLSVARKLLNLVKNLLLAQMQLLLVRRLHLYRSTRRLTVTQLDVAPIGNWHHFCYDVE